MALKRNRGEEEEIVESLAMNNFTRSIIVDKRAAAPARAFKCKTCDRQFDTFQALGGHTAGHSTKSGELPKSQKTHPCSICGDVFPSGQALGGHMRKHRAVADPAVSDELASSDLTIGADVAETKEGIKTMRSLDLDLNLLPEKEEDYNERVNNNSKLGSDDLQIVKEDNSKPDLQQNSLHYDDLTLKDTGFIRLKERDIKLEYYEFL